MRFGPVFVKNPWYAEKLIKEAMKNKNVNIESKIDENEFDIERKSFKSIKKYNEIKNNMK